MELATTPQEGEVQGGYTEETAASALLKRWGGDEGDQPEEPSSESDDTTDDTGEQPQGDDTPDEPDDAPEDEESGEIEIDVAGEKFKLPPALKEQAERIQAKAKEVEAGATRKFQEAADARKAVEARAEQVEHLNKIAHAQADLLADHKFVTRRLAQYEQINVQELSQNDPAALTRINAEYNQLTAAKARIEQAYQQATQAYTTKQGEAQATKLKELDEFARAHVKDWATDNGKRLQAYALKVGMSPEKIMASLSPEFIRMLDDAEYGARVRNASPQKKAETQKTLKPGSATQQKSAPAVKEKIALDRARKTGRVEDAAMALLARSNRKR